MLSNRAFVELVFAKLGTASPNPLHVDFWTAILDLKIRTRGQLMLLYPEGEPFKVSAGPQVDTAAVWIAPFEVELRGLFSGNVNVGWRETDLHVLGLWNLIDDLDATEAYLATNPTAPMLGRIIDLTPKL